MCYPLNMARCAERKEMSWDLEPSPRTAVCAACRRPTRGGPRSCLACVRKAVDVLAAEIHTAARWRNVQFDRSFATQPVATLAARNRAYEHKLVQFQRRIADLADAIDPLYRAGDTDARKLRARLQVIEEAVRGCKNGLANAGGACNQLASV